MTRDGGRSPPRTPRREGPACRCARDAPARPGARDIPGRRPPPRHGRRAPGPRRRGRRRRTASSRSSALRTSDRSRRCAEARAEREAARHAVVLAGAGPSQPTVGDRARQAKALGSPADPCARRPACFAVVVLGTAKALRGVHSTVSHPHVVRRLVAAELGDREHTPLTDDAAPPAARASWMQVCARSFGLWFGDAAYVSVLRLLGDGRSNRGSPLNWW